MSGLLSCLFAYIETRGEGEGGWMQNCKIAELRNSLAYTALFSAPPEWAIAGQVPEFTNTFQNYNKYYFHIEQIQ